MTTSDLVALVALVARMDAVCDPDGNPTSAEWQQAAVDAVHDAKDALEQLRAELATALEDASELRALDNEAQHGADELAADAKRYRWIVNEPEGARHLLSLLQREGSKSIGTFGTMIDRIRASKDAARAQAGDSPPPDNWHEPADGRRLAEHNKDK